jgi:DNA mismatch endonuclease (patch repair protein)
MMSGIKGKDTAPEMLVRRAAHRLGLRFRLHVRDLPGRPDLVLPRWRTVVFVNGCFWHRHPGCKRAGTPKSNQAFWKRKFRENVRRDARNYADLVKQGWKVIVLWQCEANDLDQAAKALSPHFRTKTARK